MNAKCPLESFRKFLILSTCKDIMPPDMVKDQNIFPERDGPGLITIEAKDKETLDNIDDIRFVRVDGLDRIIYNSKSGRTKLIWRRLRRDIGKVLGDASLNSIVNLVTARVLDISYIDSPPK
ncbi:MAG: hypothetical protein QXE79_04990, partial [Candidatus Bathyarchaeia archaeon]